MRLPLRSACLLMVVLALLKKAAAQEGSYPGGIILSTGSDFVSPSESESPYYIRNILITGNKKTNPDIILREISFQM